MASSGKIEANEALYLNLNDPPYHNYFYSDKNVAAQVVVTTPLSDSDTGIIRPRLLVAWPAGNSGVLACFAASNKEKEGVSIALQDLPSGRALDPVFYPAREDSKTNNPSVGVKGLFNLPHPAILDTLILGSIRSIRDFTEGPSLLVPEVQDALQVEQANGEVIVSRVWLDNVTKVYFIFKPVNGRHTTFAAIEIQSVKPSIALKFEPGTYSFEAHFDYPQLPHLSPKEVIKEEYQHLIAENPIAAKCLSFLSYSNKLLAGAWRFLTYFGRDSMISLLLLSPILCEGKGGPIEAGLAAVFERIDKSDGSVCHEETIGDYATYQNAQMGIQSNEPTYDYKMIDTDFFLPILARDYLVNSKVGRARRFDFLSTKASTIASTTGITYSELLRLICAKILKLAAAFQSNHGQKASDLISLKQGQSVGQWRDSEDGLDSGRVPYDVNTALMPAALVAIYDLYKDYSDSSDNKQEHSYKLAKSYAETWEAESLKFFEIHIPKDEAKQRLEKYKEVSSFPGPSGGEGIDSDVFFHAVALKSSENPEKIAIMHSDDCFRLFLLPLLDSPQHTLFLEQVATNIIRTFPAGLHTPVGILVANPAFSTNEEHAKDFTNGAYHGTVVWSWNSLAMMAKGLELQLTRSIENAPHPKPAWCQDSSVLSKVRQAYTKLWDTIEANRKYLSNEVWSWKYDVNTEDGFAYAPLGSVRPPKGNNQTESNITQLWSLTFLAIQRRRDLEL